MAGGKESHLGPVGCKASVAMMEECAMRSRERVVRWKTPAGGDVRAVGKSEASERQTSHAVSTSESCREACKQSANTSERGWLSEAKRSVATVARGSQPETASLLACMEPAVHTVLPRGGG